MNLITTALKQDAPLKDLLYSLSQDYDRLNQLMDRRETELSGYSMMMIMLIGFGLPGLIAFIVGLFTPASSGYQVLEFHRVFALFFGAASAITSASLAECSAGSGTWHGSFQLGVASPCRCTSVRRH